MASYTITYNAIQLAACHLAFLVKQLDHCLASQHNKGADNVVSDLLSYYGTVKAKPHPLMLNDPSNDILTQHFHSRLPS
jgi:hypothetical protein